MLYFLLNAYFRNVSKVLFCHSSVSLLICSQVDKIVYYNAKDHVSTTLCNAHSPKKATINPDTV